MYIESLSSLLKFAIVNQHSEWEWSRTCVPICYTCQLSRLRVENFDLTPAHACAPISHAWLKNVSCCRPAWHNFQKYVNSDPCKERKPCVKWINGNTFLATSDFWSEKHWERARLWQTLADFGRLRKTSDVFGSLRTSSGMIVSSSKIPALPG